MVVVFVLLIIFLCFIIIETFNKISTRLASSTTFDNKNNTTDMLTNIDALIGQKGIVLSETGFYKNGYVKVGGEVWLAKSIHNNVIEPGCIVLIVGISGCHVQIQKIEY